MALTFLSHVPGLFQQPTAMTVAAAGGCRVRRPLAARRVVRQLASPRFKLSVEPVRLALSVRTTEDGNETSGRVP